MSAVWQNLIVIVLVGAAGAYLARLARQSMTRRKAAACGGCSGCAQGHAARNPDLQVVAIEPLRGLPIDNPARRGGSPI